MDNKDKRMEEKLNEFMKYAETMSLIRHRRKLSADERSMTKFAFKMGYLDGELAKYDKQK